MTTEQQQVAMIQTLLHFMGTNNFKPSSSAVLAYLREVSGQTSSQWNTVKNSNKDPGTPVSGATQSWDVKSNNKGTTPVSGTTQSWDMKNNNKSTTPAAVSHHRPAKQASS